MAYEMQTDAQDRRALIGAPRRLLLVANRASRRGAELRETALARLTSAGVAMRELPSMDRNRLPQAIVEAAGDVDAIVVLGGDGALNAAAPGLIASGLPLGVLPGGTANDLARTLGLPTAIDDAVDCILAGRTRTIDLGEVNGRPYFNVVSFGLSVGLAKALNRESKKRWGVFAYALAALRALTTARPFHAEIDARDADGGRTHVGVKSWQIAVGNGVYYGGGMAVREGAEIDNGVLELYSLEMQSLWKLAPMLLHFRAGQHGLWREVRTLRATEIDIATRRPRSVNADGEIVASTPVRIRVLPRALRVYAPPDDV
ncbi:MAG: lipid kinase [Rhodoblastus sp.]